MGFSVPLPELQASPSTHPTHATHAASPDPLCPICGSSTSTPSPPLLVHMSPWFSDIPKLRSDS